MISKDEIINDFLDASINYGIAIEKGDSKKANKYSKRIRDIRKQLNDIQELELLKPHLNHGNKYVELNTAISLMAVLPDIAYETLVKLAGQRGIFAFEAEMFLEEWEKNNIVF